MLLKKIGVIEGNQDGAAYGNTLFRMTAKNYGTVWDTRSLRCIGRAEIQSPEKFSPHCNTVVFGPDRCDPADPFPLVYCNVYNNYRKEQNRREGTCGVYRITVKDGVYSFILAQIIRIGFVEDLSLWKSLPDNGDVRPYGNFVVDCDTRRLCAFTMRDGEAHTRYFFFSLPALSDGVMDETLGVPVVTLEKEDILSSFDGAYCHYIQGATLRDGKLYSCEGFCNDEVEIPRIRVTDIRTGKETDNLCLPDMGLSEEPEMITFFGDRLVYSDCDGNIYELYEK